ncbi:hypothetical protein EUGRSUZ_C01346 [Eucalyptus grandis]|uniref:Uncharacterized protein n=2 Tax=Eucalyptus grandis TaxID=71139 RepID=A0ACC3LDH6_EUCGR|nr:hypothetical protein EUGRSUZ_C01346 [Eucalyptus grandis]
MNDYLNSIILCMFQPPCIYPLAYLERNKLLCFLQTKAKSEAPYKLNHDLVWPKRRHPQNQYKQNFLVRNDDRSDKPCLPKQLWRFDG